MDNVLGRNVHYFPSYEIMMDDLRDYRFYNKDLIHPSSLSVDYIWSLLSKSWMDEECHEYISDVERLNKMKVHRPINPKSDGHLDFLKTIELFEFMEDDVDANTPTTLNSINTSPPPSRLAFYLIEGSGQPQSIGPTPSGGSWDVGGTIDLNSGWSLYKIFFTPIDVSSSTSREVHMVRHFFRKVRLERYNGDEVASIPPSPWVYIEDEDVDGVRFAKRPVCPN